VQPLTRFVRRGGRLVKGPEPDERLTSSSSYGEHAGCGQQLISCAAVLLLTLLHRLACTLLLLICLSAHDFAAIKVWSTFAF